VVGWLAFGSVVAAQEAGPYQPVTLPDRVEAEHYDAGEAGVAWSDTDEHAGRGDFRTDDAVDAFVIERVGASGQALLGRTRDGEFVQYTVEVAEADEFEIRLRVASGDDAPGVIEVDVDGERVGTVRGNTGRWFDWRARSAGIVALDPGTHVVQLTWADGADVNLDWIDFRSTSPQPAECAPGLQEAEDAAIAGRFRSVDFDNASGGTAVGVQRGTGGFWRGVGDNWIEFCTSVETAGEFRIEAELMAPSTTKSSFYVSVDDGPLVEFVASPTVPFAVGYFRPTTAPFASFIVNDARILDYLIEGFANPLVDIATWDLAPGDHTVRFYLRRDGVYLDTMQLVPADAPTCVINGRPVATNLDQQTCTMIEITVNEQPEPPWLLTELRRPPGGYPGDPCDWPIVKCDAAGEQLLVLFVPRSSPELDQEAIEALYRANGLSPLPGSVCTWAFVECDQGQRVTSIELTGAGIRTLPAEMVNLTELKTLNLADNSIGLGPQPPTVIGYLRSLESLDLSGNRIEVLSRSIPGLSNLRVLDLTSNELLLLPAEFANLGNLETLKLGGNRLTSLPREIGNLVNLTELDLSNGQFESLPPEIGNLTNLTALDLRNNALSGDITALEGLTTNAGIVLRVADADGGNNCLTTSNPDLAALLDRVDLDWRRCDDASQSDAEAVIALFAASELPIANGDVCAWVSVSCDGDAVTELRLPLRSLRSLPAEIGELRSLVKLELNDNNLTSLPAEIGNLSNLAELELSGNQLTSLPPEIGDLTSLTRLGLGFNKLAALPAEFGNLTNVELLGLNSNEFAAIPAAVFDLTSLVALSLDGNNLATIPDEIGNLTTLSFLDLGINDLTELPPTIGDLSNLRTLVLENNELSGDVTVLDGLRESGNFVEVGLSDGLGGNDCLTTTSVELAAFLDDADPRWASCDNP